MESLSESESGENQDARCCSRAGPGAAHTLVLVLVLARRCAERAAWVAPMRGEGSAATVRIDVSSSRTGVPRPERRARLQQSARNAWASTADDTDSPQLEAISSSDTTTPAPSPAESRVLRLRLGLAELSIGSVYGCLPAADGYSVQSIATRARPAVAKHEASEDRN